MIEHWRARTAAAVGVAIACVVHAETPPEWYSPQLGGVNLTSGVINANAFAQPSSQLNTVDLRAFTFGNRVFNTNWIAAPGSVDGFDGLGPEFNRVSCSGCHTRDGRGRPPEREEAPLESMLVRISVDGRAEDGGPLAVPGYGDQLNEKALPGIPAEGRTIVRYRKRAGHYPDGSAYSLAVPRYEFADLAFGAWPEGVRISPRVAQPVMGLGLLETVPEAAILEWADPDDANGDGISGRPNRVWDRVQGRATLGRFGWKANQPTLLQQDAAAALGDIGLTSSLFPHENIAAGQTAAAAAMSGGEAGQHELRDDYLHRLTFYIQVLAVPAARNAEDPVVRHGAVLFEQIGCAGCHRPSFRTGDQPAVPVLSWQLIHPFTDLLLHDMGDDLADGRADYEATGREWRTPPLWGIGLTATVSRHTRFLHDGRARSLEEAVLWHGGEAAAARSKFMNLQQADRAALLAFLDSL